MILMNDLCSIVGQSVMPLCRLKWDRNYSKSKNYFINTISLCRTFLIAGIDNFWMSSERVTPR